MIFFAPQEIPQQPPAIIQEASAEVRKPKASDYGPPKSAMQATKVDIKKLARLVYGITVVIEGTPHEYVLGHSDGIQFDKLGKSGLRFKLWHNFSGHNYSNTVTPFWMDTSVIKSGSNKVQSNPHYTGWGFY